MSVREADEAQAHDLDRADPLAAMRDEFEIPLSGAGHESLYFCGNSLGLMPRLARRYVVEELDAWGRLGVRGHFESEHPWMPYHELLAGGAARLVGAHPHEVVAMNSLTVNLHLMMVSFYRPAGSRVRILMESGAFPSDRHAVVSQIRQRGLDPATALVELVPRPGEEGLRDEDVLAAIEREGERLALVLWPGVQYRTGQAFDPGTIARAAHQVGAVAGFDLAHATGNVPLRLHDDDADFAVWCSYKYLNSGPGSVAGCFVHERHGRRTDLGRFAGWWGHDKASRFRMGPGFRAIPTAEGWQISNPPILSLAAVRASLEVFDRAGGMEPLRRKSLELTGYLERLIDRRLAGALEILTPREPERRGCQISLRVRAPGIPGRALFERLEATGVVADWREPDVIRVAPVPLYNRYTDVWSLVATMERILGAG